MYMVGASRLVERVAEIPALAGYYIYGDKGYRSRGCLLAPFLGINLTQEESDMNTRLGSVRVSVEWYFAIVANLWQACTFRHRQRIYLSACGPQFRVAILLTNARACIDGHNQIASVFGLTPPPLETYFCAEDIDPCDDGA
jgi:hypothetical protein